MFYVTAFDPDPTKSFTNVAFNNLKALQTQNINFELRPLNYVLNWESRPSWFANEDRDYFTRSTPTAEPAALVHLQIADLLKVPYRSPDFAVGFTAFEATMIPRWICEGLDASYKGLIVPSRHCADVLAESGLKIPVRVVHHALPDMWLRDYPSLPDKDPQTYVFGSVGYWNSRKNLAGLLEAYIRAFPEPSANTALLLKTFNAGDVEAKVRSLAGGAREDIWIYDEQWSEAQMLWAFQMIDCYVAPTRGEAFGLAQAQAAALGKPVVYTGFSAPTEWLGAGHYPLDHTLVKVSESMSSADHPFDHIKGPNIQWADVGVEHLSSKLLEISGSRPRAGFDPENLGNFRQMLSWATVGESLAAALEDILDRPLERIQ